MEELVSRFNVNSHYMKGLTVIEYIVVAIQTHCKQHLIGRHLVSLCDVTPVVRPYLLFS